MTQPKDFCTWSEIDDVILNGIAVGSLAVDYEVQAGSDVRNLANMRAYVLNAHARISIPSGVSDLFAALEFTDYAAALINAMEPVSTDPSLEIRLLDYLPKTLNSAISVNQDSSTAGTVSHSSQRTRGSSTSNTQSWDVGGSLSGWMGGGATGDMPTMNGGGSLSLFASGGRSVTHSHSLETSHGSTTGSSTGLTMGTAMSIKDWASYASLDRASRYPTWIWGQEYPWDVLRFHVKDSDKNVSLPDAVKWQLSDGKQVYPPSELSLYGITFHASAKWLIQVRKPSAAAETIDVRHKVRYYTASHRLRAGEADPKAPPPIIASIDRRGDFEKVHHLNLALLGLHPIIADGPGNEAIVGFAPLEFARAPDASGAFRIFSGANNIYVTGAGFTEFTQSDGVLRADLGPKNKTASLSVSFKIADTEKEFSLYLKHWTTTQAACTLTIVINKNVRNPIIRRVDASDASSGSDNITKVILRDKDYASADYYNYLRTGLNELDIVIGPLDGNPSGEWSCGYALRALLVC
ncbi:hypothetical protein [Ensifer adhaerens]|uniref:hypothetical protein n=1 Tax=Ensifer adhaerens TaxID=106592 RepID=UPI000CF1662E|nr:hypothetical protein [Ensifer adhaerens]